MFRRAVLIRHTVNCTMTHLGRRCNLFVMVARSFMVQILSIMTAIRTFMFHFRSFMTVIRSVMTPTRSLCYTHFKSCSGTKLECLKLKIIIGLLFVCPNFASFNKTVNFKFF